MTEAVQVQVKHYPTLRTVTAVEDVIKTSDLAVSRTEILKRLENKTMRSTLNLILQYLKERGLVLETEKGFIWAKPSPKLLKAEEHGLEV